MKYDFDEIIPRRGTHSYKWDTPPSPDILPMWVADMDFKTAPPIIEALRKRVDHGIFGYTRVPDEYYDAVISWFLRRYNFNIPRESIIYTTGVVPAISAIIKAMTSPGDKIIIQAPAYNCFFSSIRNNDCIPVDNHLLHENGRYFIDFEDLEIKAADPDVRLMLLCNPHNPCGRVWTREELLEISRICLKHNVFVVSDEIHCDLTYPGFTYTPFASLSEETLRHSISCVSPSKTFNLAGIQVANIIAEDVELRKKIIKAININEVCDISAFSVPALIAAYNEGEEWLDELNNYLHANYIALKNYFHLHLPEFRVTQSEGTYLAWIDCSAAKQPGKSIAKKLLDNEKLMVNDGSIYGEEAVSFIRLNMACPRQVLLLGLEKIKKASAHLF